MAFYSGFMKRMRRILSYNKGTGGYAMCFLNLLIISLRKKHG